MRPMTPADLTTRRTRLGLTQSRLAEALGVTRNTVTRWEMGLYPIPRMAVLLLAHWPRTVKSQPRKK